MAGRRDVSELVLLDILLFLPVVSLLRFRTICKSWWSIIESSTFITQHLNHNSEKNNLICVSPGNEIHMLSGRRYEVFSNLNFECKYPENAYNIVNSCNGIVCIANHISNDFWFLSLWNPATEQVRQLPESSYICSSCDGDHKFFLGFDKETKDYKIVRISMFASKDSLVQVYNMSSDSWRTIHKGHDFPIKAFDPFTDVACNSEIGLWIGGKCHHYNAVFYFDLADEVYGAVPLPDFDFSAQVVPAFLNDKISCITFMGSSCREIWMMDEFGRKESWKIAYKFDQTISQSLMVCQVKLSTNGEKIFMIKLCGTDDGLYSFDMVTEEEAFLLAVDNVSNIFNHNESLVAVKSTKRTG